MQNWQHCNNKKGKSNNSNKQAKLKRKVEKIIKKLRQKSRQKKIVNSHRDKRKQFKSAITQQTVNNTDIWGNRKCLNA